MKIISWNYYSLCGCSHSSSSSHETLFFSLHFWSNCKYESQNFLCQHNLLVLPCETIGSQQSSLDWRQSIFEKDLEYERTLYVSHQNPHWCLKHHLGFRKWTVCGKNNQMKCHYMCAISRILSRYPSTTDKKRNTNLEGYLI